MNYLLIILWFVIFTKIFLFWLWLWQLKEYHWGRLTAHFETQKFRKIFFSFHGIRYPKFTKKIIAILITGFILESIFLLYNSDPLNLIRSIILAPVLVSILVFLFQIPTNILIKRELKKAKIKRKLFKDLIVVGVAGSYGKTAVKEILATILSEKFNVLKTEKNNNAEIGIARTVINNLNNSHQILVAEIGAYERGKIKEVCDIIKPKIGILTGINEQHLSTFGSQENIVKAKNEILENSEIKISYNALDLEATNIIIEKEFLSFKVDNVDFKISLPGSHNVPNLLLAISTALKLGMTLEETSRECSKISSSQGAMKIIKKRGLTILDASYSANSTGVIADLNYLNMYAGQKIIVMPCLIELGSASKEVHKKIGEKINEVCDLGIITTKDYFKYLKSEKIILIENPEEVVKKLKEYPNATILLEGRISEEIKKALCQ